MIRPAHFRPDKAAYLQLGEPHTDFILPDYELQVGDALVGLVVATVEGHRMGVPIATNIQACP